MTKSPDRGGGAGLQTVDLADDNRAHSTVPHINQVIAAGRRAKPRRDLNTEARIQAAIVAWIRLVAPQCVVFAIPNGGLRSKSEAARMRWTGVLAGVPDLCVVAPGPVVAFLEVKAPSGSLSPEQRAIFGVLRRLGIPCEVVRSIDDVRPIFARLGIATREIVP